MRACPRCFLPVVDRSREGGSLASIQVDASIAKALRIQAIELRVSLCSGNLTVLAYSALRSSESS